jgi:RNA polymerase sigma-70 factor (family 1)
MFRTITVKPPYSFFGVGQALPPAPVFTSRPGDKFADLKIIFIFTASCPKAHVMSSVCEEVTYKGIYNDHGKPLRNFIYYKCGDLDRAKDIMQEALIKLWENCAKIEPAKAKSFLYTVSQRIMIDEIRHDKVKLQFAKRSEPGMASDPSAELIKKEFEKKLMQSISDMPETQREAFLMNRMDNMSYKEIAETLEISVKAVEKRIHLALVYLKENVQELKIHKI